MLSEYELGKLRSDAANLLERPITRDYYSFLKLSLGDRVGGLLAHIDELEAGFAKEYRYVFCGADGAVQFRGPADSEDDARRGLAAWSRPGVGVYGVLECRTVGPWMPFPPEAEPSLGDAASGPQAPPC